MNKNGTKSYKCRRYELRSLQNAVESALARINGVSAAEVNLDKGQVRVDYDEDKVQLSDMKDAIEDQGYDVK